MIEAWMGTALAVGIDSLMVGLMVTEIKNYRLKINDIEDVIIVGLISLFVTGLVTANSVFTWLGY